MFSRTAFRPLAASARRALSTSSASSSSARPLLNSRNAVIGGTTLAVSYFAISTERRRVLNEQSTPTPSVRESVLDQKSLKEPIHKDGAIKAQEGKEIVEEKEAEASQPAQGAFNEETGEINWDCPCLGGMADGPCGEQFKAAFSCFVFSEAEPKGVNCVELFKVMQDCFREHPEIYGEEIDDDEEGAPAEDPSPITTSTHTIPASASDVPSSPTSDHPESHPAQATKATPTKA